MTIAYSFIKKTPHVKSHFLYGNITVLSNIVACKHIQHLTPQAALLVKSQNLLNDANIVIGINTLKIDTLFSSRKIS